MSKRGESWKAKMLAQGGPRADAYRARLAASARRRRRAKAEREGRPYSDVWVDRVEIERNAGPSEYFPQEHRRLAR
jgi:hypothetical protein